jgi:hypothetical protein
VSEKVNMPEAWLTTLKSLFGRLYIGEALAFDRHFAFEAFGFRQYKS